MSSWTSVTFSAGEISVPRMMIRSSLLVVVREGAFILHRAERLHEVDVACDEPHGSQLRLGLLEIFHVFVRELIALEDSVGVLLRSEEVDRDRMLVQQPALVLDEVHEIEDADPSLRDGSRPRRHSVGRSTATTASAATRPNPNTTKGQRRLLGGAASLCSSSDPTPVSISPG